MCHTSTRITAYGYICAGVAIMIWACIYKVHSSSLCWDISYRPFCWTGDSKSWFPHHIFFGIRILLTLAKYYIFAVNIVFFFSDM
jgi:hypothetical protein